MGGTVSFEVNNESGATKKSLPQKGMFDLKTIMHTFSIEPNALIIDIEGSENIILDRKPNYPRSIRYILIELHAGIYGSKTMIDIIKVIESEGFVSQHVESEVYLFTRS